MNDKAPAPTWFKVVAILGLLWNLLGVIAFFWITLLMEKLLTPEALAALPEAERASVEAQLAIVQATPVWATIAFAVAVFGGFLGCVFLLMRKNLAVLMFQLSLVGLIVQNVHSYLVANATDVYGAGAIVQSVLVLVIAVFLLWVSMKARKEGWSS